MTGARAHMTWFIIFALAFDLGSFLMGTMCTTMSFVLKHYTDIRVGQPTILES